MTSFVICCAFLTDGLSSSSATAFLKNIARHLRCLSRGRRSSSVSAFLKNIDSLLRCFPQGPCLSSAVPSSQTSLVVCGAFLTDFARRLTVPFLEDFSCHLHR